MTYLFTNMIKKAEKKVSSKKDIEPIKVATEYPAKTNNANLFVGLRVQIVNKFVCEDNSDLPAKERKTLETLFNDLNNEISKGLFGTLVEKGYGYVVEFEKEYSFTYGYNEFFKDNLYFVFNDVNNLQSTKDEKESKMDELCGFIYNVKKQEVEREAGDLSRKRENVCSWKRSISDYQKSIRDYNQKILETEILLNNFTRGDAFKSIDKEMIHDSIIKMMKNPKIESISTCDDEYGNTFVIITTKDLMYSSPRCSYNIGQFKLKIGTTGKPNAVNITKTYKRISHPCVNSSFGMCLGSQVESHINNLVKVGDLGGIATTLINFLEEPNYGHPYIQDIEFYSAQPVTIKPKTELDWFVESSWNDQQFDDELSRKTIKKFEELLKKKK